MNRTSHSLKQENITNSSTDPKTYASAVKPGTCNKSTQTENKSTQIDDSFAEYLKQRTEKTQGTQEKSNASPHPGKSNSSHPGPALSRQPLI